MSEHGQKLLVFHGAIVPLIGNLCGLPLGAAITGGWGEEPVRLWRVAHSALVGAGVVLIATGAALRLIVLGRRAASWLRWSLLAAAYGGVLALVLAASTGCAE